MASVDIECHCSEIKIPLTGDPGAQFSCHCDDCLFCDFARLPVVDGLPHYRSVPKMFGGSDETVAW